MFPASFNYFGNRLVPSHNWVSWGFVGFFVYFVFKGSETPLCWIPFWFIAVSYSNALSNII